MYIYIIYLKESYRERERGRNRGIFQVSSKMSTGVEASFRSSTWVAGAHTPGLSFFFPQAINREPGWKLEQPEFEPVPTQNARITDNDLT